MGLDGWRRIFIADEESVIYQILEWAELLEFWQEKEEFFSSHNFVSDVLKNCPSADVESDEWDEGIPGRSGIRHTIYTNNAEALRQEIRAIVIEASNPRRRPEIDESTPPKSWTVPSTPAAIIAFLEDEAARASAISGAVGGPYGREKSRICRDAISHLKTGTVGGKDVRAILEASIKATSWDRIFCERLQRTIEGFAPSDFF